MMTKSEENEHEFLLRGSLGCKRTSYSSITCVSKVDFRGYSGLLEYACSHTHTHTHTHELLEFPIVAFSTRLRNRGENNIKVDPRKTSYGVMDLIDLGRHRDTGHTALNIVTTFQVP
jgi:hypothetical protein